jgi:hydroxyacylglutathione hydrolase
MNRHLAWFGVRPLDARTWIINDHGQSLIYLLAGEKRALLIDTGWGVDDLPALVRSLTTLPLTIVNSHGHHDHFSGNGLFAQGAIGSALLNAADRFMAKPIPPRERRWVIDKMLSRRLPRSISLEDWRPAPGSEFGDLNDGDCLDLGGRTVEVISVPGHSPGSVALLEKPGGLLFTGDSVLPCVWVHLEESAPLSGFLASLCRLQARRSEITGIFPAHGHEQLVPHPSVMLDDLTALVERIVAGELVGRPEKTFAGDGLRCDFGTSGVVYDPGRI